MHTLYEKNDIVYRVCHDDNNGINAYDDSVSYGPFVGYANTNTSPITIRVDRNYEHRLNEIVDYMGDLLDIYHGLEWRKNGYNLIIS